MILYLVLNKLLLLNIMIKLSSLVVLLLLNWTVLSGQSFTDTTKCYGVTDLRKIAVKLTQGQQCDTLLKIANSQISNRDSVIALKDKTIAGYKTESSLKESIISVHKQEIDTINLQLKKTKRKLWFTKAGWMLTTLVLSASTGYFIIH